MKIRYLATGYIGLALIVTSFTSLTNWAETTAAVQTPIPALTSLSSGPAQVGFARLPLCFVENAGQLDPRVSYYVNDQGGPVFFTRTGVTFTFTEPQRPQTSEDYAHSVALTKRVPEAGRKHWVLKLDFINANPNISPRGEEKTDAVVSYLVGPREQWHTGLRTYSSVVYSEVWPGIDLIYTGTSKQLKYTMVVKPGADPNQIKLRYRGATTLLRTDDGQLAVSTPFKTLYEEKPYVYQEIDGQRVEVSADYEVAPDPNLDGQTYGFRLGKYHHSQPLILDPFISYAGYIGSDDTDEGRGVAVDSAGNAYVTGYTTAPSDISFPETVGLGQNVLSTDAFVAKVNAAGSGFVYISYIGGFGGDVGYGIAVDGADNAYVTGYTNSGDSFPHGTGFGALTSFDSTYNGNGDAFVAKLNSDGTTLLYASFIGGDDEESGYGIAIDASSNVYVTGGTCSSHNSFPDGDGFGPLTGPDLTYNAGNGGYPQYYCDAFVAKVNANGDQLLYAGYIGGSNYDEGRSIAVDGSGNAYVTGTTGSSQATFPDTVGPDTTYNGNGDAFVAKVNADGSGLTYAGYLGGGGKDEGYGIALRRDLVWSANVLAIVYTPLVTGLTEDHLNPFPATVGPDTTHNGSYDAFVARIKSNGSGLWFAGFIGGSGYDIGTAIAVDSKGYAYIVGGTNSNQASFPVKSGPDTTYNGNGDAFVAKLKKDGTGLLYAGYIGGNGLNNPNVLDDLGLGIAVDSYGSACITGMTYSDQTTFPDGNGFGALGGLDTTYKNFRDAFVVKIQDLIIVLPPGF